MTIKLKTPARLFGGALVISLTTLGTGWLPAAAADRNGLQTLPLVQVQSTRPFAWNGTWGRRDGPGAGVVIRNEQLRYYWNGREVPINNLRIGPREISFTVAGPSGRSVVLTPGNGGAVVFTTWTPTEARSSFDIYRN